MASILIFFFPGSELCHFLPQNIQSWYIKGWVVALSHGPEPTEQTLGESKENTATKSQWSAAPGQKNDEERKKEKKNWFLLQWNIHYWADTIIKAAKSWFMCTQQPPDRQLLALTHVCVIKFAFMTLCLNSVLWISVIIVKKPENPYGRLLMFNTKWLREGLMIHIVEIWALAWHFFCA